MTSTTAIHILIVEDNISDVVLLHAAFEQTGLPVTLHVTRDGEEALRFVGKHDEHRDAPTPDLILLDLNLPRLTGFDVLQTLKADAASRGIPVVVLSTSSTRVDIERSYALDAESFTTKPDTYRGLVTFVARLERFWSGTGEALHESGVDGPREPRESDA